MTMPLPCPCCGAGMPNLYVGVMSALSWGVQCAPSRGGCGLSVEVGMPERMPRGCRDMEELAVRLTEEALRRWNTRDGGAYRIELEAPVGKGGGQDGLVHRIRWGLRNAGVKIQPGRYRVVITRVPRAKPKPKGA